MLDMLWSKFNSKRSSHFYAYCTFCTIVVSNGMNIARINFSHSGDDYTYANSLLEMMRNSPGRHTKLIAGSYFDETMPLNLRGVLVDTKGPEIRTMPLQGNAEIINIQPGYVSS